MASVWKYVNDLTRRFRGALRVTYADGVTLATVVSTTPFTDLGNIPDGGIQPSSQKFEDFSSTPEGNILEGIDYTRNETVLTTKLNELGRKALELFLRAKDGIAIVQAVLSTQAIDNMDFTTDNAVIGKWYPFLNSGVRVYRVTSVVLKETLQSALIEGTDYELNKATGEVRFLTAQTVDLDANTVDAAAFNVTPLELDRQTALEGVVQIEFWSKAYSLTEPRLIIRANVIIDSEEAIQITQGANAEPTLNMRSIGAPQVIDFADAT